LPNLGQRKFISFGAGTVIGAWMVGATATMHPTLHQSADLIPRDPGYPEAALFIDDSLQVVREEAATKSDQPAPPLFGLETVPVAGELAAKWQAVEAEIDREQQVLAALPGARNMSRRRAGAVGDCRRRRQSLGHRPCRLDQSGG
jgi:hypothetical protein